MDGKWISHALLLIFPSPLQPHGTLFDKTTLQSSTSHLYHPH